MPLRAEPSASPAGGTMIEPWLMMNWHRTMDWLLLAPTLSAQEALEWGLLNKVVPRDDLEHTVEEMARRIGQIPLTTLMAVKNNVKRAYELMGMRVHLQVEPHSDEHGRRGIRRAGAASSAHRVRFEAKGFHRGRGQTALSATRCVARGDIAEHHRVGDAAAGARDRFGPSRSR